MKIEHIAIYYSDLERAKQFFAEFFNAKAGEVYHNKKTGFKSYFLKFDDGARLEIMNKPNVLKSENNQDKTGFAHIAFCVGSKEKVDLLTEKLKQNGYLVLSGPRTTGDGYYESCIVDFEGNLIEITK